LGFLLSEPEALTPKEHAALQKSHDQYTADLRRAALCIRFLRRLESFVVKELGRLASQAGDRLRKDRAMSEYNWVD
jgi:hypothetical protein